MRIPSVSPVNPSSVPSFGERRPRTSPTAYATTQAAPAQAAQQPAASNSARVDGTYSMSQINLAMLLSSQGATIIAPEMQISPELASQPHSVSLSAPAPIGGAESSGPPTASQEAQQIMDSLGSNGVLTLASVESAENGCTSAPASDLLDSNTDADITADFTQLSGGGGAMTLAQLTSAIQKNANPQNQHPDSDGKVVLPGASTATSTTDGASRIPHQHLRVRKPAQPRWNISGRSSGLLKPPIQKPNKAFSAPPLSAGAPLV